MTLSRGIVCLVAMVFLLGARPVSAQILLNEVLADPATDWNGDGAVSARDDEWVEIVNPGSVAVDLTGYRIASADTSWRYEFSGTLEPGGILVVYGSESYTWEQETGNPAYGLRLANGGGEIALWKMDGENAIFLECYAYTDHEAEDDRSSGRYPDGSGNWVLFDAQNPYTGEEEPLGTGCEPTPGAPTACSTPVDETSWGKVKARWAGGGSFRR